MQPAILNEHNMDILNYLLNQFIDEVKGDIEAWSQKGSGWGIDEILEGFINVAQYQPLRGGSYMDLPKKLKNKKTILNVQNRDNQCLRWALRAALFKPRGDMRRTSSYPTEDGLNFADIDFPTPVSQIDRLERKNPNLAINVFGWEKEQVIVHRLSEKGGEIPRINLMITKQGENTHYSYSPGILNILKVPKDPSMETPPNRTHEISSFFPQHENEAINWKLLFRAFYRYKPRHFAKTKNTFLKTMI